MQLPQTFYLYETKLPCQGCRGCIEKYHQEIASKQEGKVQENRKEITTNGKDSEASLERVLSVPEPSEPSSVPPNQNRQEIVSKQEGQVQENRKEITTNGKDSEASFERVLSVPEPSEPSSIPPNQNRQVNRVNSNGSAVVTPIFRNGVETPTNMWWDSFSPQASFDKDYFAGLAEHVEQSSELPGETEAPTMRDAHTTPTANKTSSIKETSKNDSLNKTPLSATRMPSFDGDHIYVKPIVNLESKGPCKTGEEDEVVRFAHRAKLYRFDKDVNQWKERGTCLYMTFSIKDFFSRCDQIHSFLRIQSHLLKKSLMENFIICSVKKSMKGLGLYNSLCFAGTFCRFLYSYIEAGFYSVDF